MGAKHLREEKLKKLCTSLHSQSSCWLTRALNFLQESRKQSHISQVGNVAFPALTEAQSSSTCFSAKILHKSSTSDYIHSFGTAKFGVWDQSWTHWTVPQNLNFGTKVRGSAEGSEKSSSGSCLPLAKNDNQLLKNLAGRDTAQSHLPQPWIKSWNTFKNRLYYGSLIKHT